MMNCCLDWHGLEIVCEKIGIEDVEQVIDDCLVMRNHQATQGA